MDQPGRLTRMLPPIALVALLALGIFGVEQWPITSWRLFSVIRTPEQSSLRVLYTDQEGTQRPVPFGGLGSAYHGHPQLLASMKHADTPYRREICTAWATGLSEGGIEVAELSVWQFEWDASRRAGARPSGVRRSRLWTCYP